MTLVNTLKTYGRFLAWPPQRIARRIAYVRWLKEYRPIIAEIRRVPCLNQAGFQRVVGDYKGFLETGNDLLLSSLGRLGITYLILHATQKGVEALAVHAANDSARHDLEKRLDQLSNGLRDLAKTSFFKIGEALATERPVDIQSLQRPIEKALFDVDTYFGLTTAELLQRPEVRKIMVITTYLIGKREYLRSIIHDPGHAATFAIVDFNKALERIFRFFQFSLLARHPWGKATAEPAPTLLSDLQNIFGVELREMEI